MADGHLQGFTDERSVPSQPEQKKVLYDQRFAELEFRALRGYLMNYSESGKFDKWARWTENMASALGFLGVGGGAFGIFQHQTMRTKWGMLMFLALPVSGAIEYAARGMSDLFPSLSSRAQKHVNAGAEWTRILRTAKFYRDELQDTQSDTAPWDQYERRYKELLEGYKQASMLTVIREKAYQDYNDVNKICREYDRRRKMVTDYIDHEEKRKDEIQN